MADWIGELNREGYPNTLVPQIGFELKGIKEALTKFCHSHDQETNRCTIGFFIYFYDQQDGGFLRLIKDIQIKKLEIIFPDNSNRHWLERLADADAELDLTDATISKGEKVSASAWQIHHFDDDRGNYATPSTAVVRTPRLSLIAAPDYGIANIRGYRDTLRIAYLDYGTLLHMFLAYKIGSADVLSEDDLKFMFTGAEINHGEMVSPYFQEERYKDWGLGFPGLDASVTATLKMEGIYKGQDSSGGDIYVSSQYHPYHVSNDPSLTLPGVKVLAPCRRFWHTVEQVLNSSASQMEFNVPASFYARQRGINNLSKKLTKTYVQKILGKALND